LVPIKSRSFIGFILVSKIRLMNPLPEVLTVTNLRDCYRRAEFTPLQVAEQVLARLKSGCPPEVFISVVDEDAFLARARQLNEQLQHDPSTLDRQALFGIPYAVKDDCSQ
jgi:Asp-tRNA(Asn)/Glu-tRNA(Gln) amidotransferase A subunit family amidase